MSVRKFSLGLAATLIMAHPAYADPVTLKVAHFLPAASAAHTHMIVPWCEKIEAESAGDLKCEIYPAMQLGGTPAHLFGQARDGVADIVWTLPGYTPGRFPVTEVFELPFIASSHEASSRAFWDFAQQYAQDEFKGVKPLAAWINGPNYLHFKSKEPKQMSDLKGLKVRAASRISNQVLSQLGANPMGMPLPQAVESFSKGVIDGALLPWEVIPGVKFDELAGYHLEVPGPRTMSTSTMIYVMNDKTYNRLTPEQKKVIDNNSGAETSAWIANQFKAADERGRAAAAKHGNVIYQLDEAEARRWEEKTRPVVQDWINSVSAKGHDGQALYDAATALVKKYSDDESK